MAAGRVRTVLVVVVQPAFELPAALGLGCVATGVGPTVGQGPVEPLDLAVGLRSIRTSPLVIDAELMAGVSPQV